MRSRRYLQLDVFAERVGAGNPLAVVLDADDLDDARMQSFAAWTHLPETIFLLPPSPGADYRVRIFTPTQELPFAGHPSVGAAWAALDAGWAPAAAGQLLQDCAAGRLPVRVERSGARVRIAVRAPRARPCEVDEVRPRAIERAFAGAARGTLDVRLWDNGPRWWLLELADEAAVRGLRADVAAIRAATDGHALGVAVFARGGEGADADYVVRAFCPGDGIDEDPVTGSANAAIAAALLEAGRVAPGSAYRVSQGRELGRDGRVEVGVDEDGEVWVGGEVQATIRGRLIW
ncbi:MULTISPECIES: PhzF family phenazine biosynthesis protein [Lysobacter]|uniref:PhzF family phenazine biosynthesis protein n=1 Tax=Lysobacter firmicutimachus TaxID=1792846 RepID=A0ABU8D698_9GAMM|nr:PhzF family phenazine biosynthesis protein [Lysobacter antibioticus]